MYRGFTNTACLIVLYSSWIHFWLDMCIKGKWIHKLKRKNEKHVISAYCCNSYHEVFLVFHVVQIVPSKINMDIGAVFIWSKTLQSNIGHEWSSRAAKELGQIGPRGSLFDTAGWIMGLLACEANISLVDSCSPLFTNVDVMMITQCSLREILWMVPEQHRAYYF